MALSLSTRFWGRVQKTPTCWLWLGAKSGRGYGYLKVSGRMVRAHRFALELFGVVVPAGKYVCHRCDTPLCVRPAHLFVGTPSENTQDAANKGRMGIQRYPERYRGLRRGERNGRAKLTETDVRTILRDTTTTRATLARRFGVNWSTINGIQAGRLWPHVFANERTPR